MRSETRWRVVATLDASSPTGRQEHFFRSELEARIFLTLARGRFPTVVFTAPEEVAG